ncbi:phosphotransferase family protein [Spongiibacter sp. KMU-166]|uniref:Phosphotransferase family protein n=1 Tax=Spongiibacter thalassae TaxID=2721624 RepID=A0ABX1G9Q2_9GAMM|nr:phosphotransferase family protein [Spongiibacter thalassae]NKI15891.1 phosphotransferase family protein [Spongiibacter thalassae]
MTTAQEFTQTLSRVLASAIPGFEALVDCRQLTAGASQETYRIIYRGAEGETSIALRRGQATSTSDSSVGGISLEAEAKLFKLAKRYDIPSPTVLYELQPEDGLGAGFIMNWLEGETLGHRINRRPELADIRPKLAYRCGEILGQIHSIDWRKEKLDSFLEVVDTRAVIQKAWDQYLALNIPTPMIDFTARWLLENLPEHGRQTLVHSDFRNGNLMISPQGVEAVLDWELAHIGDPIQDLGWLTVNSWRFGNRELAVGGFGHLDDLLAGYSDATGIEVNPQDVVFWQVFGSFGWSVGTLGMAHTWRTGETPSLERPVIGRRSSEAQMDCVNLLIPGDFNLPEAPGLDAGTQLPMPAELLQGVMDFLKDEAAANLEGRSGFLAKVAANSLGIAQRELLIGPKLASEERQRLQALLGQDGDVDHLRGELSKRLRADMPLDSPSLADHLRQTVAGQLAIDQPGYSALQ